jgi:hypothetical protein
LKAQILDVAADGEVIAEPASRKRKAAPKRVAAKKAAPKQATKKPTEPTGDSSPEAESAGGGSQALI